MDGNEPQIYYPGTPQQNDCVEQKFSTQFNQAHVMYNGENFLPLCEAANELNITTFFLENDLVTPKRNFCPFQNYWGKGERSILSLVQKFGKICVTIHGDNSHWAKLDN